MLTLVDISTPAQSGNLPIASHMPEFCRFPAPCTLHPAPCTSHPAPHTLHPTPPTLHPTHFTLGIYQGWGVREKCPLFMPTRPPGAVQDSGFRETLDIPTPVQATSAGESGPLRAVQSSLHKWPEGLQKWTTLSRRPATSPSRAT
jgi:hypothetical protein